MTSKKYQEIKKILTLAGIFQIFGMKQIKNKIISKPDNATEIDASLNHFSIIVAVVNPTIFSKFTQNNFLAFSLYFIARCLTI